MSARKEGEADRATPRAAYLSVVLAPGAGAVGTPTDRGLPWRSGYGAPEGGAETDRGNPGARPVLGGLEAPSGNWLLESKGRTLDVQVGVGDAGSADDLINRLVSNVEAEGVSFDPWRQRVPVEITNCPEQALGRILGTVEGWLADSGHASTQVENGRAYVLGAPSVVGETA